LVCKRRGPTTPQKNLPRNTVAENHRIPAAFFPGKTQGSNRDPEDNQDVGQSLHVPKFLSLSCCAVGGHARQVLRENNDETAV
jgi:hypothetical protein